MGAVLDLHPVASCCDVAASNDRADLIDNVRTRLVEANEADTRDMALWDFPELKRRRRGDPRAVRQRFWESLGEFLVVDMEAYNLAQFNFVPFAESLAHFAK